MLYVWNPQIYLNNASYVKVSPPWVFQTAAILIKSMSVFAKTLASNFLVEWNGSNGEILTMT